MFSANCQAPDWNRRFTDIYPARLPTRQREPPAIQLIPAFGRCGSREIRQLHRCFCLQSSDHLDDGLGDTSNRLIPRAKSQTGAQKKQPDQQPEYDEQAFRIHWLD
jgi:hypothetical protein